MPRGNVDDVHFDRRLDAEGASKDMALGMYGRLRWAYLAVVHELLHQAVIDSELSQRPSRSR